MVYEAYTENKFHKTFTYGIDLQKKEQMYRIHKQESVSFSKNFEAFFLNYAHWVCSLIGTNIEF